MATVNVVMVTKDQVFPAGTVLGGYEFSVNGVAQPVTTDTSATFLDVAEGDGTASVQAVDANGAKIGSAVTAVFSAANPVTLKVPDVLTVTVG